MFVWSSNPRMLAVSCNFGGLHLEILVGYAPQAGRPAEEILAWWKDVADVFGKIPREGHVLFMGDFNCKIGSVPSNGIGEHAADFEDLGGESFRLLCEQWNLIVPSTWSEFHQGTTCTYQGPKGAKSRIDYIAVDQRCREGIAKSYVDIDIDLLNEDRDHHVLILELTLEFTVKGHQGFLKKGLYDRAAVRASKDNGYDLLSYMPEQHWNLDVNEHWCNMRNFMQKEAAYWFPKQKRHQRQLYFNQETWDLVCIRKDLRQQHRQFQRDYEKGLLAMCFKVWCKPEEVRQHLQQWTFCRHLVLQQDALVFEARSAVDRAFRTKKKIAWKAWIQSQLQAKIEGAQTAQGSDLYKILKPKQMIQKSKGKSCRHLPGLKDGEGAWKRSRLDIAVAWQKQFGAIENSEVVSFEQLMMKSQPRCLQVDLRQLLQIPTLYDVEGAIRALNSAKAPGVDNLGTELYQMNVEQAAKRIFPIHLKTALRRQNVPELTGGWLLPLHKKGSAACMGNYRAILLEPTIARMLSRAWRPRLVQGLERVAQPLQYGGRKGIGIEALHLQVKLWQSTARCLKQSLGLIFIDIRAAFYSVVKPMIANTGGTVKEFCQIFQKLRLPESVFQDFLSNISSGDFVRKATQSDLVADGVSATLSHTWFIIPQGNAVMAPATGSRPGDPSADVLFSFALTHILQVVRQRATEAGLELTEPTSFGRVNRHLSWVDDIALMVTGSAASLVSKVTQLLAIVTDTLAEHAMRLSCGPGKTAVMLEFRGPKAVRERQKVEVEGNNTLPLLSEHWGKLDIPIVAHYKHLGGHIVRGGSKLPEMKVRVAATLQNLIPLKRVLSDKQIPLSKRQMLLRSMGMSILTLHAGTLWDLTQGEYQAWQAAVFRTYQVLQARNKNGDVIHQDLFALAKDANSAMPLELLYLQRIRLFIHLLQNFDDFLVAAVLQNHHVAQKESWIYGLQKAILWWQSQLGHETIPEELVEVDKLECWHHFRDAARELKRLLKKAEKSHLIRLDTYCQLKQHAEEQNTLLEEMGWVCTQDVAGDDEECKEFTCQVCHTAFTTAAAVAVHQQKVHGQRMAVRRFVKDGVCRCCGKNFHTRPRLMRHLQWSTDACWIFHFRNFLPMSIEETEMFDQQDIGSGQAVHQKGLRGAESGRAWCWATEQDMTSVLQICDDAGGCSKEAPTQEEIRKWQCWGCLPPGKGGRPKTERRNKDFTVPNVMRDTSSMEDTWWRQASAWEPDFDWIPRPLATNSKFFLIVFSGHRREGDIASWIHWNTNIQPVCIDVAIHETHGNALQLDTWVQLIRSRRVVGAHLGPPCETYSAARWIPCDDSPFPRPLRTSEDPWGCGWRTVREVWQCHIGTILMLTALKILLWVYAYGGSATLEHPKGAEAGTEKWSIWQSAFLKQLLQAADVQLITFLQGPLGQKFPKPTTLLAARLPDLASQLYSSYDPSWKASEWLGGKVGKTWRTTRAKVYPRKLCRVLAMAHMRHAELQVCDGEETLPLKVQEVINALSKVHDPYDLEATGTSMCADFSRVAQRAP